jgi:hypothetical protein
MVFSANLQRRIDVPLDRLNHFDLAEIEDAIAAIPGYPEIGAAEINAAAVAGDINARFVIEQAKAGHPLAAEWASA